MYMKLKNYSQKLFKFVFALGLSIWSFNVESTLPSLTIDSTSGDQIYTNSTSINNFTDNIYGPAITLRGTHNIKLIDNFGGAISQFNTIPYETAAMTVTSGFSMKIEVDNSSIWSVFNIVRNSDLTLNSIYPSNYYTIDVSNSSGDFNFFNGATGIMENGILCSSGASLIINSVANSIFLGSVVGSGGGNLEVDNNSTVANSFAGGIFGSPNGGALKIVNTGEIKGNITSVGPVNISNSNGAQIIGNVTGGKIGSNIITNLGTMANYVSQSTGDTTLTNSGTLGNITAGAGSLIVNGNGGTIGNITGSTGSITLNGTAINMGTLSTLPTSTVVMNGLGTIAGITNNNLMTINSNITVGGGGIINNANLILNSNLASAITNSGPGAVLSISPQSFAPITVTSNYILNNNATHNTTLTHSGTSALNYGQVNFTGTVSLQGGIINITSQLAHYAPSNTCNIITGSSVTGAPTLVIQPPIAPPFLNITGAINNNGNAYVVTVTSNNYDSFASTPNSQGIGKVLENLRPIANSGDVNNLLTGLESTNISTFDQTLKSLLPKNGSTLSSTMSHVVQTTGIANTRLALLRDAKEIKGYVAGDNASSVRVGGWARAIMSSDKQKDMMQSIGYHGLVNGIAFGVDLTNDETTILGFGGAISRNIVKSNMNDSKLRIVSRQLLLYNNFNFNVLKFQDGFLETVISLGNNKFNSTRNVVLGSYLATAKANFGGHQYSAKLQTGFKIKTSEYTHLTPLASLQYIKAIEDPYSEAGGGAINANVDPSNSNQLNLGAGLKMNWNYIMPLGYMYPELRSMLITKLGDLNLKSSSNFAVGGGAINTAVKQNRLSLNLGAALSYHIHDNVKVVMQYDFIGAQNYKYHSAMANIRYLW